MMTTELIEEIAAGYTAGIVPITVDQYHEMIRAGIIPDGSPIELIDGILMWKDRSCGGGKPMGHDPRHALLVMRVLQLLQQFVPGLGCHLRTQLPVALTDVNEPEPDIAVIHGTVEDFATRHPGPADVMMVIEIADTSLRRDRTTKQRLYAKAGIPTYWIVNLQKNQIEVYEQPDPARELYAKSTVHKSGETLMLRLQEHEFPVELSRLLA
jgi:Putative restriction endonuclease